VADRMILPNPLGKKPPKAPRNAHPGEPTTASATTVSGVPLRRTASNSTTTNRVGPNRVRKSLYLPADIAHELTELTGQIHWDSRGKVSKAEAAGELIRLGLANVGAVFQRLGVEKPHGSDV